jgi:hypothetical protein
MSTIWQDLRHAVREAESESSHRGGIADAGVGRRSQHRGLFVN